MPFTSTLHIAKMTQDDADERWVLTAPLVYDIPGCVGWVVPPGFVTDFASVPRLPLLYWFMGNTAREAAVLHDYLYKYNRISRAYADRIFREAAASTRVSGWRRWIMWAGVRVGGWRPWNRYRRLE